MIGYTLQINLENKKHKQSNYSILRYHRRANNCIALNLWVNYYTKMQKVDNKNSTRVLLQLIILIICLPDLHLWLIKQFHPLHQNIIRQQVLNLSNYSWTNFSNSILKYYKLHNYWIFLNNISQPKLRKVCFSTFYRNWDLLKMLVLLLLLTLKLRNRLTINYLRIKQI